MQIETRMLGVKQLTIALAMLILLSPYTVDAEEPNLPPEAKAVQQYILETDYPELFENQPYKTQIENLLIADIDNDGSSDVIVHFTPHYRQSAPIVLYKLDENLKVRKVVEGLAPGPLQKISGEYLDSHVLGTGVDFSVQGEVVDEEDQLKLVKSALDNLGGVVAYQDFLHADGRSGSGAYIDMTHIDSPSEFKNCEDFEFSKVRVVAVGPLNSDSRNHLAAWVGDEIWLYRIGTIRGDGLLEKEHWIQQAPDGFDGFTPGMGLAYSNKAGESIVLSLGERVEIH